MARAGGRRRCRHGPGYQCRRSDERSGGAEHGGSLRRSHTPQEGPPRTS
ncbi:hypothetical protein SGM_6344 [Streptomyces griseoaurantiacus M045]|uniref:Uncharacterized protein n=1 Tax=Streptomyces griseoaurantiacus M045 TaxID=996637 RepID=F3NTP4_9ACTN|nr:hypothetical protein SGM_6344 [Streptomyces griseoaurantiacus M045]